MEKGKKRKEAQASQRGGTGIDQYPFSASKNDELPAETFANWSDMQQEADREETKSVYVQCRVHCLREEVARCRNHPPHHGNTHFYQPRGEFRNKKCKPQRHTPPPTALYIQPFISMLMLPMPAPPKLMPVGLPNMSQSMAADEST